MKYFVWVFIVYDSFLVFYPCIFCKSSNMPGLRELLIIIPVFLQTTRSWGSRWISSWRRMSVWKQSSNPLNLSSSSNNSSEQTRVLPMRKFRCFSVTKGGATMEVKIIIQPVAVPWAQDIALYFFVDASQSDQVITSSIYLSQCEYLKTPSNTTNSKKTIELLRWWNLDNEKLVFNNTLTMTLSVFVL